MSLDPSPASAGRGTPLLSKELRWTCAFAAVAGWGVVQLVGRLTGPTAEQDLRYFLTWPIESAFASVGLTAVSLSGLFSVGVVSGLLHPRWAWIPGVSSVALFPLTALVECFADGTLHSLLPFEFVFYGMLAIPGLIGATLAGGIRARIKRRGGVQSHPPQ